MTVNLQHHSTTKTPNPNRNKLKQGHAWRIPFKSIAYISANVSLMIEPARKPAVENWLGYLSLIFHSTYQVKLKQ